MGQGWFSRVMPRVFSRMPMGIALGAVAAVWVLGCVWSFTEQSAFATAKGFSDPMLLPLVIDGLAAAMGGVAFAASLDARPAVAARVGTALAVLASAASNGLWAAERSTGPAGPDPATVAIGVGIPIAANIAFEVLLAELRRQVQRRRGLPAPVPLPTLRVARLLLNPWPTFQQWRRLVLDTTDPTPGATIDSAPGAGSEPPRFRAPSGPPPEPSGPGPDGPGGRALPAPPETATASGENTALAPAASPAPLAGATATSAYSPPTADAADASAPDRKPSDPADAWGLGLGEPADTAQEAVLPGEEGSPAEEDEPAPPETNTKVWRLAEYVRERSQDPETLTGEEVVELGLCSSTRNGRRLKDPPPRPDVASTPRLLLPGESPTLALVAREDAR
jgi:hypothetical protein